MKKNIYLLLLLIGILGYKQLLAGTGWGNINDYSAYPDTCRVQKYSDTNLDYTLVDEDNQIRTFVYFDQKILSNQEVPIVVMVNGNGLLISQYDLFFKHLADNGYFIIFIERSGGGDGDGLNKDIVILDIMDSVIEHYEISRLSPTALIGHSMGGTHTMKMLKRNKERVIHEQYNIKALITLAPTVENVYNTEEPINAFDTTAYLSLYGSQDMDVTGLNENYDPFAAYEYVGNERSTIGTNSTNREGELFKSMVFIHGADHRGLIGDSLPDVATNPIHTEFISTPDQFCITKAYTLAFLNWHLLGHTLFKDFFQPPYIKPLSVHNMVSNKDDYMGRLTTSNPMGSPLRMFFQTSPKYKNVIQSFLNNMTYLELEENKEIYKTENVIARVLEEYEFRNSYLLVRNITRKLLVSWGDETVYQNIGFSVSDDGQDVSSYSHISVRIGQMFTTFQSQIIANVPFLLGVFPNNDAEYQHAYLVLKDADGKESFQKLDYWGDIPFNDIRGATDTQFIFAHSVLNSISIPLDAFAKDVDLSQITDVGIVFSPNTHGTIMVDNLEWSIFD